MFDRFDFDSATATKQLTGTLANLPRYNGLTVPNEYFFEAMERLRTKHLNVALEAVPQPPSAAAQRAAETQSAAAKAAPIVEEVALSAEQWFERGVRATDRQDKLRAYSEAIRLQPEYAEAYYHRGVARSALGDLPGAIADCDTAIRLKPDLEASYYNRGIVRRALGDLAGAIADYDTAIRLQPEYAEVVYNNRGIARKALGDSAGAIADYDAAIRLQPDADAYNNRAISRRLLGDWAGAITDYDVAIRLKPDGASMYYNRATIRRAQKQYTSAIADYRKYLDLGGGVRDGKEAEVEGLIRGLETLEDA